MAGGTFDPNVPKVRPGTYINYNGNGQTAASTSSRGVVLLPLINHSWGPDKTFIPISNSAPDAFWAELGYSVSDKTNPQMLLIREALKKATTVIVYIPAAGVQAATTVTEGELSLTATAKYGGTRGNDLKFSIVANPMGGFDVTVYLGTSTARSYTGLNTVDDLIAASQDYIVFAGSGDLAAVASASLTGGADGVATNEDIMTFLDLSESIVWRTMAFPLSGADTENEALLAAVKSKMKALRDGAGKYRKAVVADYKADYEGVINVTNAVRLEDGTELTHAQVTAYVAAFDASALKTESRTNRSYDGAVAVVDPKTDEESVSAINNGEYFFTMTEENKVVVEYDINSLTTFTPERPESFHKNRRLRVYDEFGERCKIEFPSNRFDNNADGWDAMQGIGKSILREFEDDGAIQNVDYENDFLVDRANSSGDSTYVTVGLQAVDSAEKVYINIITRG